MDPVSRGMLAAFAELVAGPVLDAGCGPGKVTAYLAERGLDAVGVDLSPEMVAVARAAYPGVRFRQGSMAALELPDGGLGGVLAWYSTHHTPAEGLPAVYREFHRVLAPGGYLLLGGHVGDEVRYPTQGYGHSVSYEWHLIPADRQVDLLEQAGLTVTARLLQESRHLCLLARKPEHP
ncbi:SAM-dependent methyltransferase [Streptomyces tateyamensis]|uniref:SAM-dependent methyltransferase n=2 Tax=Streptomyces tateyamensis TaxID=565073 RepID=A0A2V4NSU3_9ACTN|nr:SAM-dependent methyltransferase [Streptomyces tateyamensis]